MRGSDVARLLLLLLLWASSQGPAAQGSRRSAAGRLLRVCQGAHASWTAASRAAAMADSRLCLRLPSFSCWPSGTCRMAANPCTQLGRRFVPHVLELFPTCVRRLGHR